MVLEMGISNQAPWSESLAVFERFLEVNPSTKFLRLQWLDYTASLRERILPIKQAHDMFRREKFVGITKAALGLLQTDVSCPGTMPTGEYPLYPRFESLRNINRPKYAVVQCEFREENGDQLAICPRTFLRQAVEQSEAHGLNYLLGFEIEVCFVSWVIRDGEFHYGEDPVTQGHAWSTSRPLEDDNIMNLLESIMESLENSKIVVQHFHPEAAPGQFEFVLQPLPPLEAVDTLVAAREIISTVAMRYSLRATLVPKPYPEAPGTGAHLHLSMDPPHLHDKFYAGILKHLRAIAAFTYPTTMSYERVMDSVWAGGTWIAWGTQNRETPLRKIENSHFEIKCMDGLANPYLALGALLRTGLHGILTSQPLTLKDDPIDPAQQSREERQNLGIKDTFPASLAEALDYLRADTELIEILGQPVVEHYLTVKKAEDEMLMNMEEMKRKDFMTGRY